MARIVSEEVYCASAPQLCRPLLTPFKSLNIASDKKGFTLPLPKLPHQLLGDLFSVVFGSQKTPIFGPTTVAEFYNPFQRGQIPGIVLGFAKELPRSYPSTSEISTVDFRVRNTGDENKTLSIQVFERFCKFEAPHRCEWDINVIPAGPPTNITLRPGGVFDANLAYYTPPHPAARDFNFGDIVRMDVIILVTDQHGNQSAVIRQMRPEGVDFPALGP